MLQNPQALWSPAEPHLPGRLPGRLIAIEGFDGAGKTTQIAALAEALRTAGHEVMLTRQPTDWYRSLPQVGRFLAQGGDPARARALALLAAADRLSHAAEVLRPALARGAMVICDRYVFSSIAFFRARGLDPEFVALINAGIPRPDVAIYLDVPPEVSQARLRARDGEAALKAEERSVQRIGQIMGYFRDISADVQIVAANRPIEAVRQDILARVGAVVPALNPRQSAGE